MNESVCLAILVDELFDRNGNLKLDYVKLKNSNMFNKIEKNLVYIHASIHCDTVGSTRYTKAIENIKQKSIISSYQLIIEI